MIFPVLLIMALVAFTSAIFHHDYLSAIILAGFVLLYTLLTRKVHIIRHKFQNTSSK